MKNKHIESIKRKLGAISLSPNQPGRNEPIESDDGSRLLIEIKNKTVSFPEALAILEDSDGFDGEVPSGTYTEYLEGLGYKIDESDVKELENAGEYGTYYNSLMNIAYDIFYNGRGHSLPENDQVWEELAAAYADAHILVIRENVHDTNNAESIKGAVDEISFASNIAISSEELVKSIILDYFGVDDDEDDE